MRVIMRVMARKASPPTREAILGQQLLHDYFTQSGDNVNALAQRLSIVQSTLQRFYTGETKSVSGVIQSALNYAHNQLNPRITSGIENRDNGPHLMSETDLQLLADRLVAAMEPILVEKLAAIGRQTQ